MKAEELEGILIDAAKRAATGTLSDKTRVSLYRLALTIAAEEFYRIESNAGGSVNPPVLMLLQQISALCSDKVDVTRLMGAAAAEQALKTAQPEKIEVVKPKLEIVR